MSMATAPAPTTTQPAHDSALRTMASSVMTSDADDVDESLYEPQRQAPPTRW
jgi:hypothetical protein